VEIIRIFNPIRFINNSQWKIISNNNINRIKTIFRIIKIIEKFIILKIIKVEIIKDKDLK
jgi:hypothetical protein